MRCVSIGWDKTRGGVGSSEKKVGVVGKKCAFINKEHHRRVKMFDQEEINKLCREHGIAIPSQEDLMAARTAPNQERDLNARASVPGNVVLPQNTYVIDMPGTYTIQNSRTYLATPTSRIVAPSAGLPLPAPGGIITVANILGTAQGGTAPFASSGTLYVRTTVNGGFGFLGRFQKVTYTGISGNSFTGCSSSGSGTMSLNNPVEASTRTFSIAVGQVLPAVGVEYDIEVTSIQGPIASSGIIEVTTDLGVVQTVAYKGIMGNKFTGCTGGTGTLAVGGLVEQDVKAWQAIRVKVSGVTINLNGQTLTGPGAGQSLGWERCCGIATDGNLENITIRNGKLPGFSYGIMFSYLNLSGSIIKNIILEDLDLSGQYNMWPYFDAFVFGTSPGSTRFFLNGSLSFEFDSFHDKVKMTRVKCDNNTGPKTLEGLPPGFAAFGIPTTNKVALITFGVITERVEISNMIVTDCSFSNHTGGGCLGFLNRDNTQAGNVRQSRNNTFIRCKFDNNSSLEFEPYQYLGTVPFCFALGFHFTNEVNVTTTINQNFDFSECSFSGNKSQALAQGCSISNIDGLKMVDCKFENNVTSGDLYPMTGLFYLREGGGSSNWVYGGYANGLEVLVGTNVELENIEANGNQSIGGPIVVQPDQFVTLPADPQVPVRANGIHLGNLFVNALENVNAGSNFVSAFASKLKNVNANNNFVNRPKVLDAKGFGIVNYASNFRAIAAGARKTNMLELKCCKATGNDYGFGFSDANLVRLDQCRGWNNRQDGLYLAPIANFYVNPATGFPVLSPLTDTPATNVRVIRSKFNKNARNGVYSVLTAANQSFCETQACKNAICNWVGVVGKNC